MRTIAICDVAAALLDDLFDGIDAPPASRRFEEIALDIEDAEFNDNEDWEEEN